MIEVIGSYERVMLLLQRCHIEAVIIGDSGLYGIFCSEQEQELLTERLRRYHDLTLVARTPFVYQQAYFMIQ